MNRERKAGILFAGTALAIVLAVGVTLASGRISSFRYTVVFNSAKGIESGDPVRLNGFEIGEVDDVKLDSSGRVNVRLSIKNEHREKVLADSTAVITESAGRQLQPVVEIHNTMLPSPPIEPHAVVEGKEGPIDLNGWLLSKRVEQFGQDLAEASKEFGKTARQFTNEATRTAQTVATSVLQGINDALKQTESELNKDKATGNGEGKRIDPGPVDPQRQQLMKDFDQVLRDLERFANEMAVKGMEGLSYLIQNWERLREEALPMLRELIRNGKQRMAEQLEKILGEIDGEIQHLREKEMEPSPSAPTVDRISI